MPDWMNPEVQPQIRLDLVELMLENGNPDQALQMINGLRGEGLASTEMDILQGRALRMLQLYEEAESILEDVVQRRPRKYPDALNELGIIAVDRGHLDVAVSRFEDAYRFAQDEADYANNLGFALMSAGRHEEAVDVLRAALRRDPTRGRVRNNLGFALVALTRTDEAYRVFRSASSEDEARYNLGVGLELTGQADAAAEAYAAALMHNPQHWGAKEALDRLQQNLPAQGEQP